MGHFQCILIWGISTLSLLLCGCMPSVAQSKGMVTIHSPLETEQTDISLNRYILVSFWDYPAVNQSPGKIVINQAMLAKNDHVEIKFPPKGYWVVWTPVFGTQHLAPEPGIMIFHEDYFLSWSYGITCSGGRICCQKPDSCHQFQLELLHSEQDFLDKYKKAYGVRMFILDILDNKNSLLRKLEQCKGITADERKMVFDKLKQAARSLGITHSI